MAAELVQFAYCVVEKWLQLPELGESARDIGLDPSTPTMPEPELKATKVERVGSQLTQDDANSAAA